MIARIVLWASAAVAAYIYIGFPLLLAFLQRFARRPVAKRPIEPTVSVLVAAYNEAKVIEAKIRNSIALDYPADRIDIAIACDGPKDGTTAIAQRTAASIGHGRVRVFAYPHNRGKLHVLNDTMRAPRYAIAFKMDFDGKRVALVAFGHRDVVAGWPEVVATDC